jgi:hypothetical protein
MNIKTKTLLSLILLGLLDAVIPLPIIGLILIYVIFERPSQRGEAALASVKT